MKTARTFSSRSSTMEKTMTSTTLITVILQLLIVSDSIDSACGTPVEKRGMRGDNYFPNVINQGPHRHHRVYYSSSNNNNINIRPVQRQPLVQLRNEDLGPMTASTSAVSSVNLRLLCPNGSNQQDCVNNGIPKKTLINLLLQIRTQLNDQPVGNTPIKRQNERVSGFYSNW